MHAFDGSALMLSYQQYGRWACHSHWPFKIVFVQVQIVLLFYLLVDSSPSILSFLMAVLCKDDGGDMESVSEYKYGFWADYFKQLPLFYK